MTGKTRLIAASIALAGLALPLPSALFADYGSGSERPMAGSASERPVAGSQSETQVKTTPAPGSASEKPAPGSGTEAAPGSGSEKKPGSGSEKEALSEDAAKAEAATIEYLKAQGERLVLPVQGGKKPLELSLDHVNQCEPGRIGEDEYFVCALMKDAKGKGYEVDIFLKKSAEGSFQGTRAEVRKAGKKSFYSWKEDKKSGRWVRSKK